MLSCVTQVSTQVLLWDGKQGGEYIYSCEQQDGGKGKHGRKNMTRAAFLGWSNREGGCEAHEEGLQSPAWICHCSSFLSNYPLMTDKE